MADDLAGILAGNPLAPLQLQALQSQQLVTAADDPSKWADMGWGGALAHALSGAVFPGRAQAAVQQISDARTAALPDLAQAYAADNPYDWAANNPNANPLARAMILSQNPTEVAGVKSKMAETQLQRAQAGLAQWQLGQRPALSSGGGYLTTPHGAAPGGGGVGVPGVTGPASTAGTDRTALDDVTTGRPQAANPFASIPPAGPQRMAWLARLTPQQRAYFAQKVGGAASPSS
jgi:hypothetical protein